MQGYISTLVSSFFAPSSQFNWGINCVASVPASEWPVDLFQLEIVSTHKCSGRRRLATQRHTHTDRHAVYGS